MNIINNNYRLELNYSPELIHVLKQFFAAAEQRNGELKKLAGQLQTEMTSGEIKALLQQLIYQSEETEIDIELVKKLLG